MRSVSAADEKERKAALAALAADRNKATEAVVSYLDPSRDIDEQTRLSALASRSKRVTPLLLDDPERREIAIDVQLPAGSKLVRAPVHGQRIFRSLKATVSDELSGGTLRLRRSVELSAERIEPAVYPAFQAFCRSADALALEETMLTP